MSVRYLTPSAVADQYGVGLRKVLAWIERGELAAVNVANRSNGQPRWRISPAAVAEFEQHRASQSPRPTPRLRRAPLAGMKEYV